MLELESPNYPPKVLIRERVLSQGTAASLPLTVTANANLTITIPFSFGGLASPLHARIRMSLWGSTLTTDSGGATFITLQSANIQTQGGNVAQPLNTGSALGLLTGTKLGGFLEFDTDDLAQLGIASTTTGSVVLVVHNNDSSDHTVTAASVTVLIEKTRYQDAYRTTV